MVRMAHAKLQLNTPTLKPVKLAKKGIVIGGGPAGIQAASDLAQTGIEVTLVEKNEYIGGHVCQIPYLTQCESWPAMCVSDCVAPVQARKAAFDPLVEIITNTEATDIIKANGNFLVTLNKGAAFVDPDKCVGCGQCVVGCKVEGAIKMELAEVAGAYVPVMGGRAKLPDNIKAFKPNIPRD